MNQQIGRLVKAIVPRPIKRRLRQLANGLEMANFERQLKKKYGRELITTIHRRDEMVRFLHDHSGSRTQAVIEYLRLGDSGLRDLEEVLGHAGHPLDRCASVLEFASGYGRFTRFLVRRLDPDRLMVSDIDRDAVDFARKTFGVGGFYSTAEPEDLDHQGRYDVVFVASLFSHLPHRTWRGWAERLCAMLPVGGLLVFSTHGPDVVDGMSEDTRRRLENPVPGFYYLQLNETYGRLPGDQYGAAFVSEDYVGRCFAMGSVGRVARFYPRGLCGFQDLYVIERVGQARG